MNKSPASNHMAAAFINLLKTNDPQYLYITFRNWAHTKGHNICNGNIQDAEEGITLLLDSMNSKGVDRLFRHRYNTYLTCDNCHKHTLSAPSASIFIHIHPSELHNMSSYVMSHTNQIADYKCEHCNKSGGVTQRMYLGFCPRVLCVHIKRYDNRAKLTIPLTLNIPGVQKNMSYSCVAQLHYFNRHYYTIVNRAGGIKKINDHTIINSRFEETSSTATILIYERT